MDKSIHEEHLSQPLQTINKQFKIAVTFITGYNGIFNVTNCYSRFYFKKTIAKEEDYIQITIPIGAYEIKNLKEEINRIIIDKGHYTEENYPFTVRPNLSTLGTIIKLSPQGPIIGFIFEDSIGNLLGFHETILWQDYNLSHNPVDILSFDNIFIHKI